MIIVIILQFYEIIVGFEGRIEPINFDELDESLNSMESTGISSSQGIKIMTLPLNIKKK